LITRRYGGWLVGNDLTIFGEGSLTFREFAMREPLRLATIHSAILEFLQGRSDAVLFGAHAVNAYVREPRMTQDVDILALRGSEFAEELRAYLGQRFHIAVRVRKVRKGIGYRIYQVQRPENRHLADVRPVDSLPPFRELSGVQVADPAELIAGKVRAYHHRRGKRAKAGTDWRDIALLLLAFPELKSIEGPVKARLTAAGADESLLSTWQTLVREELVAEENDEDGF
jgi:hypothetical protein